MNEDDFQYVVQGRLIKAWFLGVEVSVSTTALREAIGWKTSFRSCGLPPSTWGSYGLVRGRRGHPIDAVW